MDARDQFVRFECARGYDPVPYLPIVDEHPQVHQRLPAAALGPSWSGHAETDLSTVAEVKALVDRFYDRAKNVVPFIRGSDRDEGFAALRIQKS